MTTTPKQIGEQLVAIHTALVEKIDAQPWTNATLSVKDSGECLIRLYGTWDMSESSPIAVAKGKTFDAVIKDAFRLIAEIPDANTAAKRKFHKNLANVIDEGNALNLPKDVMAPLNGSMKAMSENLLTHEGSVS